MSRLSELEQNDNEKSDTRTNDETTVASAEANDPAIIQEEC
jgi:hypothetical protein